MANLNSNLKKYGIIPEFNRGGGSSKNSKAPGALNKVFTVIRLINFLNYNQKKFEKKFF